MEILGFYCVGELKFTQINYIPFPLKLMKIELEGNLIILATSRSRFVNNESRLKIL